MVSRSMFTKFFSPKSEVCPGRHCKIPKSLNHKYERVQGKVYKKKINNQMTR